MHLTHFEVCSNILEKEILWIDLNRIHYRDLHFHLPPTGSSQGDQSQEFFDTLKAIIIENFQIDDLLKYSVLKAKCGDLVEAERGIDIPEQN